MVGTVLRSKISFGMCSRFRPQMLHSLRSWRMDLSSPGVIQILAETAQQSKTSFGMCSRFNVLWDVVTWAVHISVGTALKSMISFGMCAKFRQHSAPFLPSLQMDL